MRNLEALNIMNLINVSNIYSILPLKPGLTVLRYSALLNFALGFAMWHVKTKKKLNPFYLFVSKELSFLFKKRNLGFDPSILLRIFIISYTHSTPPLLPFFTQRLRPLNIIYILMSHDRFSQRQLMQI